MPTPRDPAVDTLPRHVRRTLDLTPRSTAGVGIIYPSATPIYRTLAEQLATAIAKLTGVAPALAADTELMPARSTPLPAEWRTRELILLGSLNTNRVLQPLYANFLCSTDATYPGADGHDLRTIVNPYGTGANAVLAGGSSARGVQAAVDRLLAHLASLPAPFALPFLLEVKVAPELAHQLATWPYTPLDDSPELQASRARAHIFTTEPIRIMGAYTLMWSWTADERYALIARDALRSLNERMTDGYGDWHYLAERFLRAIPLLIAGGFLDAADIHRTDHLLMLTALGNQDEWWRMRHSGPSLGHRHHGKGTYEFLLLARYLRHQARPTPALAALCDRWLDECHTFLDALAASRGCDQDDDSSQNNIATIFRYALGEERHAFFTSGNARRVAERVLALHDNNGAGVGQGGYGESQSMYVQQEATVQVAGSAFYYGDGELKWILHQLPNLAVVQRYAFLHFVPVFLQKFDTGPELAPVRPTSDRGLRVLPVSDHQLAISNHPPEHIEFSGHMVNAPETWQLPEGVGLNRLPQERGFDKIVFREGYDRHDAYLFIQGYQGGFRWQGHMQAANAIVRFFQAGHVFLVQNTTRHSHADKNALLISDGRNDTLMPPIAERIATADFPSVALSVTRLSDYHRSDWTRHVFWAKPRQDSAGAADCFVVIDRATFNADGPFSVTCTWRTPGYAELHGRRWQADQGEHRFTLVAAADYPATSEEEAGQGSSAQGAAVPFVLRQRHAADHRTGDEATFQNLFYVRALADQSAAFDFQQLDARSGVILREGRPVAWCGAALSSAAPLPFSAVAQSGWASATALAFAGVTSLTLDSAALRLTSPQPVAVSLDLATGALSLQLDSPGVSTATVALAIAGQHQVVRVEGPIAVPLDAARCAAVARDIASALSNLRPTPTRPAVDSTAAKSTDTAQSRWTVDSGTRQPERIRNLRITADPLPVDHAPDQLIDTVLPELRELWTQWPPASRYSITLTLPEPRVISCVNILGDSREDSTLRTFSPLPEGIRVAAEDRHGLRQNCPVAPAADRPYKRYRDAENHLEARSAAVNREVHKLHIEVPSPPADQQLVLHEIEVFSERRVAPEITHLITADLDGDGTLEIIIGNAAHELIVLRSDGREAWRHTLPKPLTHLSAQPLESDGPPALCVGVLGGDLHIFAANGAPRHVWPLAEYFRAQKDCLFGWFNAIHSLAVWHRDASGRASLIVGGYGIVLFLNPDGKIAGHSFADGSWCHDILVVPENRPDRGDAYVRVGWNHGIQYYEGFPGPGPSGHRHSFGGHAQPMFRVLRRVIPFLNGRGLAYAWVDLPSQPAGAIFSATELGCGVLSTAKKDWAWKLEGGMSLNVCLLSPVAGRPAAITGGADGFITAIDLADGRVFRSRHCGAPVVGLAPSAGGELIVATRTSVLRLDAAWQIRHATPRDVRRLLPLDASHVLLERDDHSLESLFLHPTAS